MLEVHCFEHCADHVFFVVCTRARSIEQQSEIVRPNFIFVKQQRVGADGQLLDDIDSRPVYARFIARSLQDVNMHKGEELLLG
ncbi:hypothetical protein ABW54_07485 [Burkholderia cenocepacia]|nr:hypothetical protein ABW54_07485 [Burkholderia cenocepacia]